MFGGGAVERVILHSDANSFYASVECLHHPEIRDKPVAVGGDVEQRHGIILAKNQLAKKYNIKTGEALWQARQKCPDLVIMPPNYHLYMRFSKMARDIYLDYTDQVEPFGLDECWLDVTGSAVKGNGLSIAEEIRNRIKNEMGITVSIGVSYNKIFAKLGSDYKKPDAITAILKDNYKEIAWPLPVGDLLYVGRATEKKLYNIGIKTIGDLAQLPPNILHTHYGKWGDVLYCFANGYDTTPVCKFDNQPTIKSIGNSTTTPRDLINNEDVKIILFVLADSVARRLREQGFKGRTVCISVRDNELFSFTRQYTLKQYTNITSEIATQGYELFLRHYRWQHPIRSVGISVADLVGDSICTQTDLFCNEEVRVRKEHLDKTVDWLKNRFGCYAVQPAILLADRKLSGFDPKKDHTIHPVGYF
jgi:Nucleotidyltransferase/DNA polymerase involved in DNA repair